ncbi:hypothetical protein [Spirosoma pollinicola]|uniref:Uncharacterized protein n=1 Tax=Spirosoma pollinicola TaxID=2057025 RepID=A0A2K8Z655_9BACT|nr:hypothetical protein [Spirosoma pollinicola]AUD05362.1 hypothetical protein CWM47_28015 [Spirosoma pollinicola]
MRSFLHQSHVQHVSIIGLLAMAYQTRVLMSEPEKPLREDISLAGWPPPYMSHLMDELDVNSFELTQYARLGNDFWSSQLRLMPIFQRTIVMGLATIILTPSASNMNPNRYTPWMGYWSNELNLDSLTMSRWMEVQGITLINYLLARGFIPSEF